jgi:hypothetical protein
MFSRIYLSAIFAIAFLFLIGCSDKDKAINSEFDNIIANPSFEVDGNASYEGWDVYPDLVGFSEDTPQIGGEWSLELFHGMPPEWGFARIYITGYEGQNIFRLTVFGKSAIVGGSAEIGIWSGDDWVSSKFISIPADTRAWNEYSITDTLSTQDSDTIAVQLTGYGIETEGGSVLVDLARLELVE